MLFCILKKKYDCIYMIGGVCVGVGGIGGVGVDLVSFLFSV